MTFPLQILRLSGNHILDLAKGAFQSLTSLQLLDLSRNKIEVLQFGQFAGLGGLRHVDLSRNYLRSLPRDAFQVRYCTIVTMSTLGMNASVPNLKVPPTLPLRSLSQNCLGFTTLVQWKADKA